MVGLPAKIMRDKEVVEQKRAELEEAQAKEQQMIEQQAGVENIKGLSQASTEGENALTELKESIT
jgi:hypothetical protein